MAGRLLVESASRLIDESQFPARQGRLAFAYLVLNRRRLVPLSELAEAVWGEAVPQAWEGNLHALLSRLRRLLRPEVTIETMSGATAIDLTGDIWVDVEAAGRALDEAEGLLRAGRYRDAWGPASITVSIAGRGFMAGEELTWVANQREGLRQNLLRGLDGLADIYLALDQPALALRHATDATKLEPYRESSYARIIRAQLACGNRAEALFAYGSFRRMLAEELGVDPSPQLEAAYMEALRI